MTKLDLNGIWRMTGAGFDCTGTIPGSVYSFLLDNDLMEDPFYRQNELEAQKLMENEFTFIRTFDFAPTGDKVVLHCDGPVSYTHLWVILAPDIMGENSISVRCRRSFILVR